MIKYIRKSLSNFYKNNSTTLEIIAVYSIVLIITSTIFYNLIPLILNYPAGTVGGKFQKELENTNYTLQYYLSTLLIFFSISIYLFIRLKKINRWNQLVGLTDKQSIKNMEEIRRDCISIPFTIYIVQIIFPSLLIVGIHGITTNMISITTTFKLFILFFSFITLAAVFTYMFSKRIFSNILLQIYNESAEIGARTGLKRNIFLQLIPLFIVALLFTSLTGYSRLVKEKGDLVYKLYKQKLQSEFYNLEKVNDIQEIRDRLKNVSLMNKEDEFFIISPKMAIDHDVTGINGNKLTLSSFFIKYIDELAFTGNQEQDGHVYEYYGVDIQGTVLRIKDENGYWVIGVRYIVGSKETLNFFIVSFIALLTINIIVLSYFSRTLANDVSRVSDGLADIAKGNVVNLDKELPITSNDEIGDLVIAFNNIQNLEKKNIEAIKEQQTILLEQERLASLGQLIGGIAHNLKTPIMSIAGGIEALRDLAFEYRDSIGDKSVTDQDHKEIAKEMMSWLDRIKPYCSYMSDVISAVKGQAVQMNASITSKFTVDELIKRVELLMKHELKKFHCVLDIVSQIDMTTEIKGEVNNLVQVFDNIIINAMQAYEGQNGSIELKIVRSGDNVEFSFKDYGKGIPKEVTDKLFREMVTTKGKNGTGLGLYMSYSTIKGRFGGNMSFTSKEGCGTTIFISIPCIVYSSREAE